MPKVIQVEHPILSAQIGANLIMTTVEAVILVILGKIFYNLHITSTMPSVLLAYILDVLSIFALGFLMARVSYQMCVLLPLWEHYSSPPCSTCQVRRCRSRFTHW